jgi:hypothetical protein
VKLLVVGFPLVAGSDSGIGVPFFHTLNALNLLGRQLAAVLKLTLERLSKATVTLGEFFSHQGLKASLAVLNLKAFSPVTARIHE